MLCENKLQIEKFSFSTSVPSLLSIWQTPCRRVKGSDVNSVVLAGHTISNGPEL